MIIPIRAPASSDSPEKVEWLLIELNGELLKPLDQSAATPASLPGGPEDRTRRVELGSIKYDADGAPTMIIGNHQLKGTAIDLKVPFAVLRKRKADRSAQTDDPEETSAAKKFRVRAGVQLEVAGIAKKKIMFDKYPKSIMR